ncbi:MAG: hypothetical protein ONB44_24855 [candidate division KSB1 bacterium]|nr:hypothetical protein [candidate division KSB1 bacterium]MDZ7305364.1 hypothetical protein [candidate division KSB1 bacterium]MDZ7314458.1 hypothetical protein [candidate division KSB1 bacterium]
MIKDQEGVIAARDRLIDLRRMVEKIKSDSKLNQRQRSIELAGIRGLIEEIELEIRQYQLVHLQEKLNQLQARAASTTPAEMPELVTQIISAMQELTQTLQPAA